MIECEYTECMKKIDFDFDSVSLFDCFNGVETHVSISIYSLREIFTDEACRCLAEVSIHGAENESNLPSPDRSTDCR